MILDVRDGQLTPHFNISEFTHRGREIYISADFFRFVECLEDFREWYNRPINITSGYRPPAYNRSIGGSSNSSHLRTLAVDFPLPKEFYGFSTARKREFLSNVKEKWIEICYYAGFGCQCNFYDTYLHLGVGSSDSFRDERSWK